MHVIIFNDKTGFRKIVDLAENNLLAKMLRLSIPSFGSKLMFEEAVFTVTDVIYDYHIGEIRIGVEVI